MKLAYAFLADAAEVTPDGKVWVLGGDFDTIFAPAWPALHPAMSLVVKLLAQPAECGREHRLRVEFIDSDSAQLHPEMVIPFLPQVRQNAPHRPVGLAFVVNFQGQRFPRAGDYAFHILVDDLELGVVPLELGQLPAAEGASESGSDQAA